jgi:septal ring factor EnvC (AmiA/AmiB activator)
MNETQPTTDAWSRLWRTIGHLLGVLLRVLFVIVVAVLLAAGVYYGAPWVYRRIIQPVQSSVAQLALLQSQVDENDAQWAKNFGEQQQRIASLESQLADQGERIASLEAGLSRLDEALTAQQVALDGLSSSVTAISSDYASLDEMDSLRAEFTTLREQVTLSDQVAAQIDTLEYRIVLMQIWQQVLKTHVYLTEGNAGDAETTLELALTHFDRASALGPEDEREVIVAIQARLAQAASRLREQPIIAAQDLEVAWYELGALLVPPEQ